MLSPAGAKGADFIRGSRAAAWMPEQTTILYSLAGVALILLALIWFNNQQMKLEKERGTTQPAGSDEEEGDIEDAWLLKFVQHDGDIVGETVARDGDQLILKQAGVFKAVPVAQASVHGDEVVLKGDIDWDAAIEAGTAWHAANTKGHDPLVSEHLTRSEDVKNPALAAMKGEEE